MICCYWCKNYKEEPFSHCSLDDEYIGSKDKPICDSFVSESDDFDVMEMRRYALYEKKW